MGEGTELSWTCPACGARAKGSGKDGLWPPRGWQLAEAASLLARCPAHAIPETSERRGSVERVRWFAGPGL